MLPPEGLLGSRLRVARVAQSLTLGACYGARLPASTFLLALATISHIYDSYCTTPTLIAIFGAEIASTAPGHRFSLSARHAPSDSSGRKRQFCLIPPFIRSHRVCVSTMRPASCRERALPPHYKSKWFRPRSCIPARCPILMPQPPLRSTEEVRFVIRSVEPGS
jgi:hypothetical protein